MGTKEQKRKEVLEHLQRMEKKQAEIKRCVQDGTPLSTLGYVTKLNSKNIFVEVTKEELERLRVPGYPLLIK